MSSAELAWQRHVTSQIMAIWLICFRQNEMKWKLNGIRGSRTSMRNALFWAIAQRVVAIPCRRFGTNCRTLPKRRVRQVIQKHRYGINNYSLRNSQEERSSHLLRGGSFKSLIEQVCSTYGPRVVQQPSRRSLMFCFQNWLRSCAYNFNCNVLNGRSIPSPFCSIKLCSFQYCWSTDWQTQLRNSLTPFQVGKPRFLIPQNLIPRNTDTNNRWKEFPAS